MDLKQVLSDEFSNVDHLYFVIDKGFNNALFYSDRKPEDCFVWYRGDGGDEYMIDVTVDDFEENTNTDYSDIEEGDIIVKHVDSYKIVRLYSLHNSLKKMKEEEEGDGDFFGMGYKPVF